jgi:hypothetical protein
MLKPDGAVVHVDNRHQDGLGSDQSLPSPSVERIAELRRAYLGQNRRAGQGIRNSSPGDEAAVFRTAGFTGPELVLVPDGRTIVRSADDLVAETFSFPRPHRICSATGYRSSRAISVDSSPNRRPTACSRFICPITSSRSGESRHRSHDASYSSCTGRMETTGFELRQSALERFADQREHPGPSVLHGAASPTERRPASISGRACRRTGVGRAMRGTRGARLRWRSTTER